MTNKTLIEALERIENALKLAIEDGGYPGEHVGTSSSFDSCGDQLDDAERELKGLYGYLQSELDCLRTALTAAAEPGELRERIIKQILPLFEEEGDYAFRAVIERGGERGHAYNAANKAARKAAGFYADAILREVQPVGWREAISMEAVRLADRHAARCGYSALDGALARDAEPDEALRSAMSAYRSEFMTATKNTKLGKFLRESAPQPAQDGE